MRLLVPQVDKLRPAYGMKEVSSYYIYVLYPGHGMYLLDIEMQQYTIWVYRYIATCVSRYTDILYDTVKCELTDF